MKPIGSQKYAEDDWNRILEIMEDLEHAFYGEDDTEKWESMIRELASIMDRAKVETQSTQRAEVGLGGLIKSE